MASKIKILVEIGILLLIVGVVYSLTGGFEEFKPASLAEKASEITDGISEFFGGDK